MGLAGFRRQPMPPYGGRSRSCPAPRVYSTRGTGRGPRQFGAVLFVIVLLVVLPAVIRRNMEEPLPAQAHETGSRSPAIPEAAPTAGPQAPASLGWLTEWKRPTREATTTPTAAAP